MPHATHHQLHPRGSIRGSTITKRATAYPNSNLTRVIFQILFYSVLPVILYLCTEVTSVVLPMYRCQVQIFAIPIISPCAPSQRGSHVLDWLEKKSARNCLVNILKKYSNEWYAVSSKITFGLRCLFFKHPVLELIAS